MRILRGDHTEIDRKKGAIWSVRSDVCRERERKGNHSITPVCFVLNRPII